MENQINIAIIIALACAVMFILSLFVIVMQINHRRKTLIKDNKIKALENERQLYLFRSSLEIEDREKERIYRNMHDQINPQIRFVVRRIEMHRLELIKNILTTEELDKDVDLLLKAVDAIKDCTFELVPSFMHEVGLIKTLKDVINNLDSPGNLSASFFNNSAFNESFPFSINEQANIYRICREIIHNIIQHSSCTILNMSINSAHELILIKLNHNGIGIDNDQSEKYLKMNKGVGLKSTNARALSLNAKIDYKVFSAKQSEVTITIPLLK